MSNISPRNRLLRFAKNTICCHQYISLTIFLEVGVGFVRNNALRICTAFGQTILRYMINCRKWKKIVLTVSNQTLLCKSYLKGLMLVTYRNEKKNKLRGDKHYEQT